MGWNYLSIPKLQRRCTVEVWEWISNFILHFTGHVITCGFQICSARKCSRTTSHIAGRYILTKPTSQSVFLHPAEVSTLSGHVFSIFQCQSILHIEKQWKQEALRERKHLPWQVWGAWNSAAKATKEITRAPRALGSIRRQNWESVLSTPRSMSPNYNCI